MSTEGHREDTLNESWVELGVGRDVESSVRLSPVPLKPTNGAMEKLLLEAQRESGATSHVSSPASSHASSRSSNADPANGSGSPPHVDAEVLTELKGTDWVWDWSSRPEAIPPSGLASRIKHPSPKRCRFSIRNTRVMQGLLYTMDKLPTLIITHAVSFILGAATMFVCMKRSWSSSATISSTVSTSI